MKVRMYCNGMGPFEYDAVEMTQEEFKEIKFKRDTPDLVCVEGRVLENEYTCLNGYDGTCNCFSHPRKSWREYFPAKMKWGKIAYSL